jgi:uncharacterized protein YciI
MAIIATYTYDPASVDARTELLPDHLEFIAGLEESGRILAVGRVEGAAFDILFLLDVATPEEAKSALAADPYNTRGYISAVEAYEWAAERGRIASSL